MTAIMPKFHYISVPANWKGCKFVCKVQAGRHGSRIRISYVHTIRKHKQICPKFWIVSIHSDLSSIYRFVSGRWTWPRGGRSHLGDAGICRTNQGQWKKQTHMLASSSGLRQRVGDENCEFSFVMTCFFSFSSAASALFFGGHNQTTAFDGDGECSIGRCLCSFGLCTSPGVFEGNHFPALGNLKPQHLTAAAMSLDIMSWEVLEFSTLQKATHSCGKSLQYLTNS